jgi:ABC-type sugar transport system ATPase subunit
MNLLECQYVQEDGQSYLGHGPVRIALPPQTYAQANPGNIPRQSLPLQITLGIRPYYVGIRLEPDQQHTIPSEVFVVEPMGDMTVVSVKLGETRLQIVTDPDFRTKPRQAAWLSFDPAHTLLFDTNSGKALAN